jgi:hypothetical protein
MLKNKQPFRQDDKDSPDQFIKKMESTMSKKRKNNYKNIGELENIYDINPTVTEPNTIPINTDSVLLRNPESRLNTTLPQTPPSKSTQENAQPTLSSKNEDYSHIFRSFTVENEAMSIQAPTTPSLDNSKSKKMENMKIITPPQVAGQNVGERTSQDVKKKSTSNINPEGEESNFEGFNYDTATAMYIPEYEYDKKFKPIDKKAYDKLIEQAKSGGLSISKLKKLLNTGRITQWQYNNLFGFKLNFGGFDWKASSTPVSNERCPKWKKDCGGIAADIFSYIKQIVNYFKRLIGLYSQLLKFISTTLYKSTDGKIGGKPAKNNGDISIIVNILHYLIMIPLSIYFSYNWFYITFYRDEGGNPTEINFKGIVSKLLKGLLKRIFKHNVQPMILIDTFLRKVMPGIYLKIGNIFKYLSIGPLDFSFIGKILTNPIFIFIWLTLFILHMNCKYSEKLATMLYSYMNESEFPFKGYLHGITAYDWIVGIASVGIIGTISRLFELYISPITVVFWFIFSTVVSHLTVRFSGIFAIVYLYVMSYGAIAIYSVGGMNTAMQNINESFESSISFKDNKCPPGKWEKILINLLNAIYKYLIAILYLIVLSYSIYLIFSSMKSSSSKIILGSFFSFIVVGIIMGIFLMVYTSDPNIKKSDIDI